MKHAVIINSHVAQILIASVFAIQGLISPQIASAQSWPKEQPIKIVVGFTAGSGTDVLARVVANELGPLLGATIIVENKPGAGGVVATGGVVRSPADGYTILAQSAAHTVNPAVYSNLPYDVIKDLSGVAPFGSLPFVMVVSPAKNYKDVKDLVERAKANNGKFNYGSSGAGTATHLNAEKFVRATSTNAVHIPYRGSSEVLNEIMAGRLDFGFVPITAAVSLIRSGKLQALAVSGGTRTDALPTTPSMVESGYPAAAYSSWAGLFVSSKTPQVIVDKLNSAVLTALAKPDVRERLSKMGVSPMPMKPKEFDKFIGDEVVDMAKLVKAAGITAEK